MCSPSRFSTHVRGRTHGSPLRGIVPSTGLLGALWVGPASRGDGVHLYEADELADVEGLFEEAGGGEAGHVVAVGAATGDDYGRGHTGHGAGPLGEVPAGGVGQVEVEDD